MRLLPLILAFAACGPASTPELIKADEDYATARFASFRGGDRSNGSACAEDTQCVSGLCSATVSSCGVCQQRRLLGETCGDASASCSRSADCVAGRCVTRKVALGGTCRLQPKGGDLGDCDDELLCLGETCGVPKPLGAACKGWFDGCRGGTACDEGVCVLLAPPASDAGIPPPALLAEGDACGVNNGISINGTCASGTTCGNRDFPNGGYPQGTLSTCVTLPTEGQPAIFYHCAPGLFAEYSDGADPRCKPLLLQGAACTGASCAVGLECRHGFCAAVCQ